MSANPNQSGQSDQKDFNLVSLDSGSTKGSAFSAYTSYKQQLTSTTSGNLDFNENEGSKPPPPAPTPKPESKKPVATAEDDEPEARIDKKKTTKKLPPPNPEVKVEQTVDDILDRLDEFRASLSSLVTNISQVSKNITLAAASPFIPLANRLLKLLNGPLLLINKIANKINERVGARHPRLASQGPPGADGTDGADGAEAAEKPKPPPAKIKFSEMLELNIIFTDNMKKPLYSMNQTRGTGRLGAMEEDLVMGTAISAIKECAEFTVDLPTPTTGVYEGIPIYDTMSNITEDDVRIFLRFVKAYPGKYIGKEWKISETFATWLINNAPVPDS